MSTDSSRNTLSIVTRKRLEDGLAEVICRARVKILRPPAALSHGWWGMEPSSEESTAR